MSTVEDAILSAGGIMPPAIVCPSCGRAGPPSTFKDVRADARFAFPLICAREYLERERDDAEVARLAAPATWDSERGNDVRAERNRRLDASVWTVLPGSPLTAECQAAWAEYRLALNALTVTFASPVDVIFPVEPRITFSQAST